MRPTAQIVLAALVLAAVVWFVPATLPVAVIVIVLMLMGALEGR